MAKRNLIIIALVLVAVAAISHYSSKRSIKNSDDKIGKPIVDSALFENIDGIVLTQAEHTTELEKKGDQWQVKIKGGFPTDMEKLLKLLEKVSSYTISSLVTKDADRMGDFETYYKGEENATTENSGYQLTLKQGSETVFKVVIGKVRTSSSQNLGSGGTYIRLGDPKVVYLIKETLVFESNPQTWLQSKLFSVEKDHVKSVSFNIKDKTFSFEREDKDKKFKLNDLKKSETLDSKPLSGVINDLNDFAIEDIKAHSDQFVKGLKKASVATIDLFDGKKIKFEVLYSVKKTGKDEVKSYFVKFHPETESFDKGVVELNQKWLFTVEGWKIKKWFKAREEYLKDK